MGISIAELEWTIRHPDPVEIAANVRTLRAEVAAWEREYGMTADEAHKAIDAGTLIETHDVCIWLMRASLLARIDAH